MKLNKKLRTISGSLFVLAASSAGLAADNIAVINTAYLFQNHPDRELVGAKIDAELEAPIKALQALEKDIVSKVEALEKEAPKLRAADIQQREQEINQLRANYQEQMAQVQQKNEQLQFDGRSRLLSGIQAATKAVAEKEKYTLVLDINSVVYLDEKKDISEQVLKNIQPTKQQ